ncbi:hypothetical protein H0H81_000505, partial [Sphagnurus paluster]
MTAIGEMHFVPSGHNAWYNLPRAGGVAYAAQESWVMNATIKDNILFNAPLDEERYSKVIYQCGLTRDLELFQAGDLTEVGEKGLTLSGGQKARVTLARAVYSSAEIILLDDVLAALDVHTAKWVVEQCLIGDLMKGRTILLVTHNVGLVAPISDFVVSLGSNGQILSQGTISDALAKNSKLRLDLAVEEEPKEKVEQDVVAEKQPELRKETHGKLIAAEKSNTGHANWESVKLYLLALGGQHWIFFWTTFTIVTIFETSLEILQPWLLGLWATQYTEHPPEEVNVTFAWGAEADMTSYLAGYIGLVVFNLLVFCGTQTTLTFGALRASASLHKQLIEAILGTTLRWLDETPASRVITRVTQDVSAGKCSIHSSVITSRELTAALLVDSIIPEVFSHLFEISFIMLVRFIAIMIYTPTVGLFGLVVFAVGGLLGNIYMRSQLSVKREMSKAKAPIIAHFSASIEGLTSIRAYGAQESILRKSLVNVDNYSRVSRVFNDFTRWIAIRIDALTGAFAAILGAYFVYTPHTGVSPSNSAFTLTMAVGLTKFILGFMQFFNMFEVDANSLERLQEYMVIEQEEPASEKKADPPAYWPSSGKLEVQNLSARYSPDGPKVLHGLSFSVRAGERIGIVGRTGSGKSSLALALLRCIPTEFTTEDTSDGGEVAPSGADGGVWLDGVRTDNVGLQRLRGAVSIIPQMPELLSGTLRRNLDPFDQFDDVTLNAALRDAGLFALQDQDQDQDQDAGSSNLGTDSNTDTQNKAAARLTLDSPIARAGSNLSVGQRQIIALARAMVRGCKVLVLDEATSAIGTSLARFCFWDSSLQVQNADYATDAAIQASLRTRLAGDVTVLTVAHRLQTVMDADRV